MVSIMVTLILMLVISMIVIGFAQISRREQRQALDRQLSTQAFLAAETGVNDVQKVIRDSLASGTSVPEKDTCPPGAASAANPYGIPNFYPDLGGGVSYTCLLVTTKLSSIKQVVDTGNEAVTIPLHPVTGRITTLHIKWNAQNVTSTAGCTNGPVPASGYFPSAGATGWGSCPYGVLRVDMVPTDALLLNRTAMRNNQTTFYLYPTTGGGAAPLNYVTATGAVARMACTAPAGCSVDITNIDSVPLSRRSTDYALRLTAIYNSGTVVITADGTSGPAISLEDAQAQIDVTGRAQDVLRRIQVRVPISIEGASSGYALQSGSSICKRFGVAPGMFKVAPDIFAPGQDLNNPLCRP